MAFIVRNDDFICEWCGEHNPPANKTCRNHCRNCLASKHLDSHSPGDRESECGGKMNAIDIQSHAKHEWIIIHECQQCAKHISNKKAEDDDINSIARVMEMKQQSQIFGK